MADAITALVPMKAHSERVPGKNLRPLGGRPLCLHILAVLQEVPAVARIVINTDSEEIARVCEDSFAVTVHDRPEEIRGDFVSMNRIIADDLGRLREDELFLQTHATNPLLSAGTLAAAIDTWLAARPDHDSLFSVTRHQARFYDSGARPVNHDPAELLRTQDLPPLYEENSCFYLFSRESFALAEQRIGSRPLLHEIDPLEAIDIDDERDWQLAEALLGLRESPGGADRR